ncbi:MAG: TolC family protein [Puniceicoccaceae bacterium]
MNCKHLLKSRFLAFALVCTPLVPQASAEMISLNDALYEALESNLTLRINAYQALLREQEVESARAIFDPTLVGSINTSHQEQDWTQSESDRSSVSLGLSKRLQSGTSLSLQSNYLMNDGSRFDSSLNQEIGGNLSHNSGITLSIRQPLLQGFGRAVNMANIWKAEASLAVAQLDYKNNLLDTINQTEKAYWQVAFQDAQVELSKSSVTLAKNLVEETEQRVELGLATRLDLLQARANLASQQESLIDSQRALKDAEDALLLVMGRLDSNYEDVPVEVADLADPSREFPSLDQVWAGALAQDLDLLIQQTQIESLGFDKVLAKDRNRSELDVVVSGSTAGYDSERGSKSFWGAFEPQGHDWGVGLELNVPIGKRASKAQLRQIDATIEREYLRLDQLEQSLFLDVRQAWRSYQVSLEKLDAARLTLELQQEAFDQEQAKYSEGLAVFRDVQQAQQDLDRARISELNAWFAALRALSDLSRLDGSILERHRINLNFN